MRNIADTITRLTASRLRLGQSAGTKGADRLSDLPEFGSNPGALRARIYLPEGLEASAPLVVVLHGCTQTAAGYDHGSGWSRLADRHGFALLFAEQQRANNPNLCFNWFVPADIMRGSGEALSIRQMVEAVVSKHAIDSKRIFVTGLSAGGAMASVMLATYPEVFAGGAIIAGLPYGTATTVPEAFDRMRGHGGPDEAGLQALVRGASRHKGPWPLISVWQGSGDRTVDASNADAIVAQWRALHEVGAQPGSATVVDGHPRRVWRDAEGRERIESFSIAGMGHGTPLDTSLADGGAGGPYMLDVGISSSLHSLRFWGFPTAAEAQAENTLKPGKQRAAPAGRNAADKEVHAESARRAPRPGPAPRDEKPRRPIPAKGVGKVIEDALRAAGLMR